VAMTAEYSAQCGATVFPSMVVRDVDGLEMLRRCFEVLDSHAANVHNAKTRSAAGGGAASASSANRRRAVRSDVIASVRFICTARCAGIQRIAQLAHSPAQRASAATSGALASLVPASALAHAATQRALETWTYRVAQVARSYSQRASAATSGALASLVPASAPAHAATQRATKTWTRRVAQAARCAFDTIGAAQLLVRYVRAHFRGRHSLWTAVDVLPNTFTSAHYCAFARILQRGTLLPRRLSSHDLDTTVERMVVSRFIRHWCTSIAPSPVNWERAVAPAVPLVVRPREGTCACGKRTRQICVVCDAAGAQVAVCSGFSTGRDCAVDHYEEVHKTYCVCKEPASQSMVACSARGCATPDEWYHFSCVGLATVSVTDEYYCSACACDSTSSVACCTRERNHTGACVARV
jgi:hypothetical protein